MSLLLSSCEAHQVSYCFLLSPAVSRSPLLSPNASYCLLLSPKVLYCLLLFPTVSQSTLLSPAGFILPPIVLSLTDSYCLLISDILSSTVSHCLPLCPNVSHCLLLSPNVSCRVFRVSYCHLLSSCILYPAVYNFPYCLLVSPPVSYCLQLPLLSHSVSRCLLLSLTAPYYLILSYAVSRCLLLFLSVPYYLILSSTVSYCLSLTFRRVVFLLMARTLRSMKQNRSTGIWLNCSYPARFCLVVACKDVHCQHAHMGPSREPYLYMRPLK